MSALCNKKSGGEEEVSSFLHVNTELEISKDPLPTLTELKLKHEFPQSCVSQLRLVQVNVGILPEHSLSTSPTSCSAQGKMHSASFILPSPNSFAVWEESGAWPFPPSPLHQPPLVILPSSGLDHREYGLNCPNDTLRLLQHFCLSLPSSSSSSCRIGYS